MFDDDGREVTNDRVASSTLFLKVLWSEEGG